MWLITKTISSVQRYDFFLKIYRFTTIFFKYILFLIYHYVVGQPAEEAGDAKGTAEWKGSLVGEIGVVGGSDGILPAEGVLFVQEVQRAERHAEGHGYLGLACHPETVLFERAVQVRKAEGLVGGGGASHTRHDEDTHRLLVNVKGLQLAAVGAPSHGLYQSVSYGATVRGGIATDE